MRSWLYQWASLRYQQRCTAWFTEKQRDFSCHCDSRYVGCTSQRCRTELINLSPNLSALALLPKMRTSCSLVQIFHPDQYPVFCFWFNHWTPPLQNPVCARHYDDIRFSILAQGLSPFHLSALEATFIKTSNPALWWGTEFMFSLNIVH